MAKTLLPSGSTCKKSFIELSKFIGLLEEKGMIQLSTSCKPEVIERLERLYEVRLPDDYYQFARKYGRLVAQNMSIFGFAENETDTLSLESATLLLRLSHSEIPLELLPIEELGENRFACMICSARQDKRSKHGQIVEIEVNHPKPTSELAILAPCFVDYMYSRLSTLKPPSVEPKDQTWEQAWMNFKKHVRLYQNNFNYDHSKGGKLPRSTDWRPYRYCIQDVVFGVTVLRHLQEGNCLLVDVFLTAEVPEYGDLAGARALITFLLSEAYKCGGSMEIRFTQNVENGCIPEELHALAKLYDIKLGVKNKDRIEADEAKSLYSAVTEISNQLETAIRSLEKEGRLKMALACYVVQHGIWNREQLEMIVLGSENPDAVLTGSSRPEQRHLFYHDLIHCRAALLAGMFERILIQREHQDNDGVNFDLEDDFRKIEISFDGSYYAKKYHSLEPIELAWLLGANSHQTVPENMPFQVLVRPRDKDDLSLYLEEDIRLARKLYQKNQIPTFVLVPSDFMQLAKERISSIQKKIGESHIGLLMCPESVSSLDVDALQRLENSRILRQ